MNGCDIRRLLARSDCIKSSALVRKLSTYGGCDQNQGQCESSGETVGRASGSLCFRRNCRRVAARSDDGDCCSDGDTGRGSRNRRCGYRRSLWGRDRSGNRRKRSRYTSFIGPSDDSSESTAAKGDWDKAANWASVVVPKIATNNHIRSLMEVSQPVQLVLPEHTETST
jgi:hypothetical protein